MKQSIELPFRFFLGYRRFWGESSSRQEPRKKMVHFYRRMRHQTDVRRIARTASNFDKVPMCQPRGEVRSKHLPTGVRIQTMPVSNATLTRSTSIWQRYPIPSFCHVIHWSFTAHGPRTDLETAPGCNISYRQYPPRTFAVFHGRPCSCILVQAGTNRSVVTAVAQQVDASN